MAKYYKVPKKVVYKAEKDTNGSIIGYTDTVIDVVPDMPDGIPFICKVLDDTYYEVKVQDSITLDAEIILESNVSDNLKKSKVKGVK